MKEYLEKRFRHIRNVDPETHRQWLRLQQAIVQREISPNRRTWFAWPRWAPAIAAVVILIGISFYVASIDHLATSDSPNTYATVRGERHEILLTDGSTVTLAPASELVVHRLQGEKPRQVSLKGEAYFSVHRGDAAFIVSTEYADVEVVGTEFNVRARGEVLEVGVLSGSVNVRLKNGERAESLLLSRLQMAIISRDGLSKHLGAIPSAGYPGWMHGKLLLDRTPFEEACREIELRFNVTVEGLDGKLSSNRVTGILNARSAEEAVVALCELAGVKVKQNGTVFTVY